VDLVLDLVGASAWQTNLSVLRERGRLVLVGLTGGARTQVDLSTLLRKRLSVVGTMLRGRSTREKVEATRGFERRYGMSLERATVRPVVDRCFPLEQAAQAHAYMADNANFGKIVLTVSGG
jgi:NADPH:quinone reductase-like Zn-dependent oxidoreductase